MLKINTFTKSSKTSIEKYSNDHEKMKNKFTQLLYSLYEKSNSYHNHKEKMSHIGIGVQLAITSALISKKISNYTWAYNTNIPNKWIFVFYLIIWVLLHIFIRWQLRKKRAATIELNTYQKTLMQWSYYSPSSDELKPHQPNNGNLVNNCLLKLKTFIDFVFPIPCASVKIDITKKNYPNCIVEIWEKQEKKEQAHIHQNS